MAVNSITGKEVHFDDCFRYAGDLVDGDMNKGDFADAKGQRYAVLIAAGGKPRDNVMRDLRGQAERQTEVAELLSVRVKWYFAEPAAADYVREQFGTRFPNLIITVMAPSSSQRRR